MTANLEQFTRDLDGLLKDRALPVADPALQAATVLLALGLDSESTPPADLRARWLARTQPANERTSFMTLLRTRPLIAVLMILIVLLVLSGVAYALGRSLGYIPGYGIVDQNVQMLVLPEPVSQTREGITISIDEIILTPDTMYMTTTMKNIPSNLFIPMSDTTTITCRGDWVYELPDGSQLNFEVGSGSGNMEPFDSGDPSKLSYHARGYSKFSSPIDLAKVAEMTLFIPCVTSDLPAGSLPENWEFHLKFVAAPEGLTAMTAFPVIEYTPFSVDPSLTPENMTGTPEANPITLTKVIDTGDGYILMGEVAPPPGSVSDYNSELGLFDANNQHVIWEMPMDIDLGTPTAQTPFAQVFAMQFRKADVTSFPLTIQLVAKEWAETPLRMEFDAGENPQPGDEWKIDQSFDVDGHMVTLNGIRVVTPQMASNAGGFQFAMTFSDYDISVTPSIEGYPSLNEGFGGGGGGDTQPPSTPQWSMNYSVEFSSMPKGKVIIILTVKIVTGEQTWNLQWRP